MTKTSEFFFVAVVFALLFMIIGYFVIGFFGESFYSVSGISEEERYADLNNAVARDLFCRYEGFDSGLIYGFGVDRLDHAGSAYGYGLYCIRNVEESGRYSYNSYKKWLVSVEINVSRGS